MWFIEVGKEKNTKSLKIPFFKDWTAHEQPSISLKNGFNPKKIFMKHVL